MSDPQRLLFNSETTLSGLQLLESWNVEQPSAAARAGTLVVLGLGGTAVGAAAAGRAASALKGSSIAPKASALWALSLTKWIALGAIGVGVTVAGALYLHQGPHQPPPEKAKKPSAESALVAAPLPTPVVTPLVTPMPTAAASPLPESREAPTTNLPPAKPRPALRIEPHGIEGTMGQEIAKLDRARAALTEGDPLRTQQLVNDYEARFPEGSFLEEAEVLRIEALLQQGDRAGATRVGTRFLGSHPTSPHAARVRTLLGSPP